MLQNAYFLAKIGADTAENEQHFAEFLPKLATTLRVDVAWRAGSAAPHGVGLHVAPAAPLQRRAARLRQDLGCSGLFWVRGLGSAELGKLAKICKFLVGSFSAVSKRNFARKYAFDSIFQALQDLHIFVPLQSQNFRKKSVWKISNFCENSATLK